MLKAVAALPRFRGECDPGTWLYRIAVNAWKSRRARAAERFRGRMASLDGDGEGAPMDPPAPEPPPDRGLEAAEEQAELDAALAEVEPQDRAALVLRELEEKSYEEIAGILDVPLGTVKSRLHRARAALARALEGRHAA